MGNTNSLGIGLANWPIRIVPRPIKYELLTDQSILPTITSNVDFEQKGETPPTNFFPMKSFWANKGIDVEEPERGVAVSRTGSVLGRL